MSVSLGYVILYVADVGRTAAFYADAFGLSKGTEQAGVYVEMQTGNAKLAFCQEDFALRNVPFRRQRKSPPYHLNEKNEKKKRMNE